MNEELVDVFDSVLMFAYAAFADVIYEAEETADYDLQSRALGLHLNAVFAHNWYVAEKRLTLDKIIDELEDMYYLTDVKHPTMCQLRTLIEELHHGIKKYIENGD